jgi:hypothetical protein
MSQVPTFKLLIEALGRSLRAQPVPNNEDIKTVDEALAMEPEQLEKIMKEFKDAKIEDIS